MSNVRPNRHGELAHFLRVRREHLSPTQVGLPDTGRRRTPGLRRGEVAMLAGVQRLLDAFGTSPGCLIDARMNVVTWNTAFSAVFGDLEHKSERDRNMLWVTFDSEEFRLLKADEWEEHAKLLLAQFRAGYAQYVDDPWWKEQIETLFETECGVPGALGTSRRGASAKYGKTNSPPDCAHFGI